MAGEAAGRRRPLYGACAEARLISTTVGNAGLWYDKFCDEWADTWTELHKPTKQDPIGGKLRWVQGVTSTPVGDAQMLEEAVQRQATLVGKLGGRTFTLATVWRFASGLGRSHPVENGFTWHHGLGVPYLPGSGIKGVARAWAVWNSFADIDRLFGPAEAGAVGSVVFLDALPAKPVALDADVMTPHYGPWYQEGEAPGDWHPPTPIPFLTVAPDQTFQFALLPRTPADQADCERAATLLRGALAMLGAGAKTAAGYGVFGEETRQASGEEKGSNRATAPAHGPSGRAPRRAVGSRVRVIEYEELGTVTDVSGDTLEVKLDSDDEPIKVKEGEVEWQ